MAPSGITGNMTTLHEIPDDIFDTFSTSSKLHDCKLFYQIRPTFYDYLL